MNDDTEKARKSVSKAITEAIASLAASHPALAGHLKKFVSTGKQCIYSPFDGAIWDVRW
jgi:hypothetical protein